jgi:plasmid stabilization system protein ParE
MRHKVIRSPAAEHDLDAIFDFLFESYVKLGDDADSAFERAAERVPAIDTEMGKLGRTPHQGTLRPELRPGLRSVTKDRAIFYFEVDEEKRVVRVLAVFFGGQDHQRAMLRRVMGEGRDD